jgi:hypothetical protein
VTRMRRYSKSVLAVGFSLKAKRFCMTALVGLITLFLAIDDR